MKTSTRHHYVPQFYLRNFSEDGRRVYAYHLASSKLQGLVGVREQSQEQNFHVTQQIEGRVQRREGSWSKLVKAILDTRNLPGAKNELRALQELMLFQHVRTKRNVDEAVQFMRDVFALGYVGDSKTPATVEDFDAIVKSISFEAAAPYAIHNSLSFARYMSDLSMLLLRSVNGDFVTSDNPAFFWNPYAGNNNNKVIKGVQVVLPISSEFCLLLYDASTYDLEQAHRKRDYILIQGKDRKLLNRLQVLSANEVVYWHRERSALEVERLDQATKPQRRGVDESYSKLVSEEEGRVLLAYRRETSLKEGRVLSFLSVNKEASRIHPSYRPQVLRE